MKLRNGLPALWRNRTEAQIGYGEALAVTFDGIDDASHDILASLERPQSLADLRRRARAAGATESLADSIVAQLDAAGALAAEDDDAARLPAAARRRLLPDANAWSLLRPDGAGWGHLARRGEAVVEITDLGTVGLAIAQLCALAGVGRLRLTDPRLVAAGDEVLGGYSPLDVGLPRSEAAARILHDRVPELDLTSPADPVDLVVLVDLDVHDPVRARHLLRNDIAHLPVLLRPIDASVGPLIRPGAGPCLHCLDLHRSDADPCWAAVATQLRVRQRTAGRGCETLLGHAAATLAAAQVLAFVDGLVPAAESASIELSLPDAWPRRRDWSVHPDCGCRQVGGNESAAAESHAAGEDALRGRPRPRLTATTRPATRISPPHTPHGSDRSRAPARHSARKGHG